MYTLELWLDPDSESPTESDGWKVVSFGSRHSTYQHPEKVGLSLSREADGSPRITSPGLRRKLSVGLAFWLSYYEHGQCSWMLKDSLQQAACPDWRWDGVTYAGLLLWDAKPADLGPKTLEDRRKDAEAFVRTYTDWCNGSVYGYTIEDDAGELVDSSGGYYESDLAEMWSHVRPLLEGHSYTVTGAAAWLIQRADVPLSASAVSSD